MKEVLSYIICNLFALTVFAQEQPNLISPTKVTTIGYWNIGDKISYQVTSSNAISKSATDKPTIESTNTSELEITVIDSTQHTYILEIRYQKGSIEGLNPQVQEMMNSWQTNVVVRYQTDEFGAYETILNLDDLQKDFLNKFNEFKQKLVGGVTSEETKKLTAALDEVMTQFSKPENIEVLYIGDILPIHSYYGVELNLNKSLEVDLEFPCFSNISVKGIGKISLKSINKAKDIATFSIISKPNQQEIKKYMKFFFHQLFPDSKEKVKVEELNIQFENKDQLVMHLSNGWMESIETSRTFIISDSKEFIKKIMSKQFIRK
jgi:hypothetical protein